MKNNSRNRIKIAIFLVVAIGLFAIFNRLTVFKNLDAFAAKIIKTCASDASRTSCYDREIPKLLERSKVTMEEAFAVTEKIQEKDKTYLYCHTLGHELADIETKRDPAKWLDVVTRCPALTCNSGCPHGAIQRRFKGSEVLTDSEIKEILPELNIACEPRGAFNPTEVERSMCYHSLGHLAMYITGANIDRSLDICKQVGVKPDGRDYYQTCVQGVFMIIYQSLDTEDVALVDEIKPDKEDIPEFCSRFEGLEFVACRTEALIFFLEELREPSGVVDFCGFTGGGYGTQWCYATALGLAPLQLLESKGVEAVAGYCQGLPKDKIAPCFGMLAVHWVQDEPGYADVAVSFCQLAEKEGVADICWNDLLFYSKWSFHKDTEEWETYCSVFPEPQRGKCLSGDVPENSYQWGN